MPMFADDFRRQHALLLNLSERLKSVSSDNLWMRYTEARHLLETIAAHVRVHLEAEDEGLYRELGRSPTASVRETSERFAREMGGLKEVFASFERTWSENAIWSNPTGFAAEWAVVMEALSNRIEREERELYPMADSLEIHTNPHPLLTPHRALTETPLVVVVHDCAADFVLLQEAWKDARSDVTLTQFPDAEIFLQTMDTQPVPDLMIIDIRLSIHGGNVLTRRLRASPRFSTLPIIVWSSASGIADRNAAAACGATGFFPKPATYGEYFPFVQTMNDLIAYHRNA
ncbi:MAG: hemerythrin domain-containing protein [Planctomycetes bacterium]|nr:hemerythrin domain-containing protein [Planctomycetota bacterium]